MWDTAKRTSGQSNLTEDRIAAAVSNLGGNSIRQMATMCTHIRCRSATLRVEIHLRTIFRHRIVYGNSVLG